MILLAMEAAVVTAMIASAAFMMGPVEAALTGAAMVVVVARPTSNRRNAPRRKEAK